MRILTSHVSGTLFLAVLMTSCQSIQKPELNGIENFRVSRMGNRESTLTLDLNCYNPNKSRFVLRRAEGEAWLDSIYAGHFTVDTLVRIPASGDFRVPVKLRMDMKFLLKNPVSSLLRTEKMVRLEGKARVGKSGIFINYPIKYEGMQDLGKLIK